MLEHFLEPFFALFFPAAHAEIDWSLGYSFLDKELQQVVREAEIGRRVADKLVQVWRRNGADAWVLVHIEVQSQEESAFAERMYVYHYRLFDRYRRQVASLAVLGDDRESWQPREFFDAIWGCEVRFRFPIVKLLAYRKRWAELEASRNPFATVVMAHLKALETRQDPARREQAKLFLTQRLYDVGFSRADIVNLFRFIDWVMALPEERDDQFWRAMEQFEEAHQMPYVTSVERIGIRKGREEGSREGLREGLLTAIELGLDQKFGATSRPALAEIRAISDSNLLQAVLKRLWIAGSLDEVRQAYAAPQPESPGTS